MYVYCIVQLRHIYIFFFSGSDNAVFHSIVMAENKDNKWLKITRRRFLSQFEIGIGVFCALLKSARRTESTQNRYIEYDVSHLFVNRDFVKLERVEILPFSDLQFRKKKRKARTLYLGWSACVRATRHVWDITVYIMGRICGLTIITINRAIASLPLLPALSLSLSFFFRRLQIPQRREWLVNNND